MGVQLFKVQILDNLELRYYFIVAIELFYFKKMRPTGFREMIQNPHPRNDSDALPGSALGCPSNDGLFFMFVPY